MSKVARELLHQAESLRWGKRFDEAIAVLEEAVMIARADGPPDLLATCLSWLGLVYSLRGSDDESLSTARKLQEEALLIEQGLFGDEHPSVAETLRLLGATVAQSGATEQAYELLARSVAISRALNIRNRSACDALARLSDVAFELGHFDQAALIAQDYLATSLSEPLTQLEEMAGHVRAGRALLEGKRPAEALSHFQRSLEIARARGRTRGIQEMEEWVARARAQMDQETE